MSYVEMNFANGGGASSADKVSYDDTTTQLGADNVQNAIESLNSNLVATDGLNFRFATDGEGNYGYLGADDSFVPFKSGGLSMCDYLIKDGIACAPLVGNYKQNVGYIAVDGVSGGNFTKYFNVNKSINLSNYDIVWVEFTTSDYNGVKKYARIDVNSTNSTGYMGVKYVTNSSNNNLYLDFSTTSTGTTQLGNTWRTLAAACTYFYIYNIVLIKKISIPPMPSGSLIT